MYEKRRRYSMHFDQNFLEKALPQSLVAYKQFPTELPQFSIDSRTLMPGDIFIALQGAQQDGHDFLELVLAKERQVFLLTKIKKISF